MESWVRGSGNEFGGLGWVGVGCCIIGGVFGVARAGWSGLSVMILMRELAGTWVGSVVDVLDMVGGSKGEMDWVGREEGGSNIGINSCSIGSGKSLAVVVLLQWACQLLLTGCHRSAACKVGGHFCVCVGREVSWFGGKMGCVVISIGSCRME